MKKFLNLDLLLAIGLCTLPVFNNGFLLALICLFLTFSLFGSVQSKTQPKQYQLAILFLFIPLSWVIGQIINDFSLADFYPFFIKPSTFSAHATALYAWLAEKPPAYIVSLRQFISLLVFVLVYMAFSQNEFRRERFKQALKFGVIFFLGALFFQLLLFPQIIYPNHNSFWRGVGRWTGSFSDPNAFGVMWALLLPLFITWFAEFRRTKVLMIVLYLFVGALSGSRSFFAGVFIAGSVYLWNWRKKYFFSLLGISLFGIFSLNIFAFFYTDLFQTSVIHLPVGLKRFTETLIVSNFKESFYSRGLFFRYGFEIWLDHPFLGAGFARFRELVPIYSDLFDVDNSWVDNSNNFYLGILAETGLLGFLAFCGVIWLYLCNSSAKPQGKDAEISLVILVLLLFVGPHLDFLEVSVLAGFLLAEARLIKQVPSIKPMIIPMLIVAALIIYSAQFKTAGLYNFSKNSFSGLEDSIESSQKYSRWTRAKAKFIYPCLAQEKQGGLWIRSGLKRKLQVDLSVGEDSQQFSLNQNETKKITFLCAKHSVKRVKLNVNQAWVPKFEKRGGSSRVQGVQLIFDGKIDRFRYLG